MKLGKRVYWTIGLVAVLALAGAAVTFTARLTSAGGSTPSADACDQQEGADEGTEAVGIEADTDSVDAQCGDQNEAADANDSAATGADTVVPCSDPAGANDAAEAKDAPDTDNIQEQCGPQDAQD